MIELKRCIIQLPPKRRRKMNSTSYTNRVCFYLFNKLSTSSSVTCPSNTALLIPSDGCSYSNKINSNPTIDHNQTINFFESKNPFVKNNTH